MIFDLRRRDFNIVQIKIEFERAKVFKNLFDCGFRDFSSEIPNPQSQIGLVLRARLELARLTAWASKTHVATNYTISAAFDCQKTSKFEFIVFGCESLARHFSGNLFRQ